MRQSIWSTKGGKQDDVDTLSYTLSIRKGSSCAWLSFHCFKESEKSLNKTLVWSTDCGSTSGAPCQDSGQWSKDHPRSMDGVEGSQTYQYMHGIYRGRGSQVDVVEARKSRWLSDRGQESVCVLRWMNLTTCDVSASPVALLCQKYMQEK